MSRPLRRDLPKKALEGGPENLINSGYYRKNSPYGSSVCDLSAKLHNASHKRAVRDGESNTSFSVRNGDMP